MQALRNPTIWIVNFGVVAVCSLSGPFGTLDALPGGFWLLYWGPIVLLTSMLALWFHMLLSLPKVDTVVATVLVGLCFGLLTTGIVLTLSSLLLSPLEKHPAHGLLISYSFPSAVLIFLVTVLGWRSKRRHDSDTGRDSVEKRPSLYRRLEKFPHAREILTLTAQDHYVEVVTDKGRELCLLRLNDSIAEMEPVDGFQIHRSHWVARSAVKRFVGKGSAPRVELTDGRQLAINRSRLSQFHAFLNSA